MLQHCNKQTMQKLTCNGSESIYNLSGVCLDNYDETSYECRVEFTNATLVARYIEGAWLILVAILGIFGNLATLLSISFSAMRKSNGLHRKFKNVTIFILHLCLVDLIWCLFCALPASYESLMREWPFGKTACSLKVILSQMLVLTESFSVAFISLSRCLDLTKSNAWRKVTGHKFFLFVMLIFPMVIALPSMIPYFIPSMEVTFGWNCAIGRCGLIQVCMKDSCEFEVPRGLEFIGWYLITGILISILITGICYIVIWKKAMGSSNYLRKEDNVRMELQKRDQKMTRTILLLIATHCVCNIPMLICQCLFVYDVMSYNDERNVIIWLILLIVYLTQPALNFFIYAGSNEQYRLAYRDYWKYITFREDVVRPPNITKEETKKTSLHNSLIRIFVINNINK